MTHAAAFACMLLSMACEPETPEAVVPAGQILCLTEHAHREQVAAIAAGRLVVVTGCGVAGPELHVVVLDSTPPGPSLVRAVGTDLNLWVNTADLRP